MSSKKTNKNIPDSPSSAEDIMRKYDKESATRIWTGKPAIIVKIILAAFSLYCIWSTLFSTADLPIRLSAFLGLITIMGYLTYPINKNQPKENYIPFYDIIIMLLGAACFFYYCFNYTSLIRIISSSSAMASQDNAWFYYTIAIIGILCLVELCRRCVGIPILCVAGVLVIYTFISMMKTTNQSFMDVLSRVLYTMFYGTSGIFATPVQVCLKFIAVFIIFGAFLERTGISQFFINLANSIAGSSSGGPAKVAVISSALCGMVSGSSVGNTVTTGSITIPMMKRTGYKPEFAAAVEAASSTGGQIMPPIMGAAAFLMAEYVGEPYGQIALWAILPALLYFFGIFIAVHLEAKKLGLHGIPRNELPNFWKLQKQIYLLIPLVLLIWLVAGNIRSLQFSASLAIVVAIIVFIPGEIIATRNGKKSIGSVFKDTGLMIVNSLEAGGKGCITVAVACSMAGVVSGCITVTGLASKLVSSIVAVSQSIPYPILAMLIALFLTMLCCIVLGMGVPTTANYCIMASTCAPILISLGIPKVASHFFVFYFGIVADITPPVALAAYAGSAIAKSDPMKTGVNATKLAIAAFIVPYVFAINPSMLLLDQGVLSSIQVIITSLLGIFGVAAGLNGFVFKKVGFIGRILFIAAGLTLLVPSTITDVVGLIVIIGLIVLLRISSKKNLSNANA